MKRTFFGMQRANGDWFTEEIAGKLYVVVFGNQAEAETAQERIGDFLVYSPRPLTEPALRRLTTKGEKPLDFWVVNMEWSDVDLERGVPISLEHLLETEEAEDSHETQLSARAA